ncbi:MAG TPA: BatD family protein [Polyangiales bacterium]|nr:BatD family protein [Polyangiales bacterium]
MRWLVVLLLGFFAARAEAQPKITMSASSNRVSVGEPFAIEVRIQTDGDEPDKVDLPDLGEFELLGRSTSRPFSFSFGFGGQRQRSQSQTIYGFTLRTDAPGAHVIRPAIMTVGGRRIATGSLTILVVDPAGSAGIQGVDDALKNLNDVGALIRKNSNEPPPVDGALDGATFDNTMFVRTVVDKKRAYLGEQVTVTLYLYLRGQLSDSPQISREPTLDGFWSHDLLPMQRSLGGVRQEVNGRVFNAFVLRKFAAFPLRPGTLEIGPPTIEVGGGNSLFDLFNGPSQPIKREGIKVAVEALPLPAQPSPGSPTYTGALQLEATLEPAQAKVGDAVTLRVVAKGSGNLRGLTLPNPSVRGLDTLAPQIDDQIASPLDRLGGQRTFRWLLLPRQPGTQIVPSFIVDAFDPQSGTYQTVRSNPLTLTVTGSGEAIEPEKPTSAEATPQFGPLRPESALRRRSTPLSQEGFFWPSVLAAPALLALAFLGRSLRRRVQARRAAGRDTPGQREVTHKLEQAAQAGATGDARAALGLLASALKKALELKLGEPIGGMTSRALEGLLGARGFDPQLQQRVMSQLGALEAARFDPAGQSAVQLSQAQAAVREATAQIARAKIREAA